MKMRIQGNALRLRLTQQEVARFRATGRVEEVVEFGADPREQIRYALEASPEAERLGARYDGRRVVVLLPAGWVEEWAETDRVGFEGTQPLAGGRALSLLVEKDFQCLHKSEDRRNPEAYPHPAERA